MLGRSISDPDGVEGVAGSAPGLGLLDVETVLTAAKALRPVSGKALGARFDGYEMHMGETGGPGSTHPFATFDNGRSEGAISADGRVMGSYVHGLLADPAQRTALLAQLGVAGSGIDYGASVDAALDEIAETLETHLDIDGLIALANERILA